jgi:3-hydroxyisobutyrate dehydrogenase/2-hydroxy-3-oxopropionate reductase
MARLGFLGLGIMGYPMARNLIRAKHEVAVWSHTAEKARRLAEQDRAICCETPRQVAESAECTFLCVGTSEMSEQVVLGENGVIEGAQPGAVVVDTSTVSPYRSRAIAEKLAERGVHFLDAPCTGSKPGAEQGALTFMVGGEKAVFDRVKKYFDPMGRQTYYCGGQGLGLHAKLTQNLILSNLLEAFCEGLVLSTKAGLEPMLMLEILAHSAARSALLAFKAPFILRRDFQTNFSTKWMPKDVGLALESGRNLGVPLPLTAMTEQVFRAAVAAGWGEEDFCSVIKVLESWSGVEVKGRK